jgi:hypothetical protein
MKIIVSRKKKAWVELDRHIFLSDIPETWSLGYALYRYLHSTINTAWPLGQNFIAVNCACGQITAYEEPFEIRDAYSDEGQVSCPHCQIPWLTFKYANKTT